MKEELRKITPEFLEKLKELATKRPVVPPGYLYEEIMPGVFAIIEEDKELKK